MRAAGPGAGVVHRGRDATLPAAWAMPTVLAMATALGLWAWRDLPAHPAPVLLGAVVGTQLSASPIAVYGALMTPLGWAWAGGVWGIRADLVPG